MMLWPMAASLKQSIPPPAPRLHRPVDQSAQRRRRCDRVGRRRNACPSYRRAGLDLERSVAACSRHCCRHDRDARGAGSSAAGWHRFCGKRVPGNSCPNRVRCNSPAGRRAGKNGAGNWRHVCGGALCRADGGPGSGHGNRYRRVGRTCATCSGGRRGDHHPLAVGKRRRAGQGADRRARCRPNCRHGFFHYSSAAWPSRAGSARRGGMSRLEPERRGRHPASRCPVRFTHHPVLSGLRPDTGGPTGCPRRIAGPPVLTSS